MICERCGKQYETYVPMDDEAHVCAACCRSKQAAELKRYECAGPSMYINADTKDEARERYMALINEEDVNCDEME